MKRLMLQRTGLAMSAIAMILSSRIAIAQPAVNAVRETDNVVINELGDATYAGELKFPNEAVYIQIKASYPNPYVLARALLGPNGVAELKDPTVAYNDPQRSLKLTSTARGSAACKKNHWQYKVGKDADLLFNDNHKCILTNVQTMAGGRMLLIANMNLELPQGASNAKYDSGSGILSYSLDRKPKSGEVNLEADLRSKARLMSALYKIYGNTDMSGGTYWAAKTVFHNTGAGDLTNLKVSYRMGQFSDWSPTVEYSLVPAGGYVVDLYYPLFKNDVTSLKSATPVDLELKYDYTDASGKSVSDNTSKRVTLLGVSQFEYSNLTDEERTGAWADCFNNSPLVAAFVTKMDEPVRQFGGMVAQYCGGQPASYSDQAAYSFCNALYELERANGIAYQSPAGYLIEYSTGVGQELKYPRDVLRDKSGTCIELAMLYAAVCENAGLKCNIRLIPGHAYPVVILPQSGNLLPIESTGLSGPAVGQAKSLCFEDAVKMAQQEEAHLQMGQFYVIDVEDFQRQGVLCPDLPTVPQDLVHTWGYKLPNAPMVAQRGGQGGQAAPEGFTRWGGAEGQVSVAFPSYWAHTDNTAVSGLVFNAGDAKTTVFMSVFHFPQISTVEEAMDMTKRSIASASGAKMTVASAKKSETNTVYTGSTRAPQGGKHIWVSVFQPTQKGVVGIFFGAGSQDMFDRNQPLIHSLIEQISIGQ